MTLEADLKFLLKSKLPLDKLINILPDCKIKIAGNPTSCFLLHFVNSITAYSRNKEASVESRKARYHVYELLWMDGLIVTKRYSKRVALLEEPIDLNDRSSYKTIYESDDVVKNIVLYNDYENFKFYIADENKILKEGELVSRPSEVNKKEIIKEIKITKQYYVSSDFIGDTDFTVKENMIYQGNEGTLLQEREHKNKDIFTRFKAKVKGEAIG